MMDFGESVEFTSAVNGKRLRLRTEIIDVVFEMEPDFTQPMPKHEGRCQIAIRGNTAYTVTESYNEVMELLGRVP